VIFLVLFGGQHLDELGAAFDQLLNLVPVDLTWHWLLASDHWVWTECTTLLIISDLHPFSLHER
jgi:hypothetical protein